ncbi:ABC transporter substrate-binding protein [Desulfuromonas thiophila]|uniref:Iron complex transport system substrate-binding protein n=1 Tax=Desulfuromonas thiophila TaxID=57664 RepID=A0A1G7D619_9BACT|nr:ABC transporter substrate-binding protein [Desulfuromonas thiophila]SDE46195.1 iron complex transport system substrate-binding protein [Desulfuromonas thiophila]
MNMLRHSLRLLIGWLLVLITAPLTCAAASDSAGPRTVTDLAGRQVEVTVPARRLVGIHSALSLLCYMNLAPQVVGVEQEEKDPRQWLGGTGRSYRLAHPEFSALPGIGSQRQIDAEALVALQPDVIFMGWGTPQAADRLQQQTGIPVLMVHNGDLTKQHHRFEQSLDLIATICDRRERAEQIKAFINASLNDLHQRIKGHTSSTTCYIGGLNFRVAHGLLGTSRDYPPFVLLKANNITDAITPPANLVKGRFSLAAESLLKADPEIIFICASGESLVRDDLSHPAFAALSAVRNQRLYRIIPHYYAASPDTVLAETWYMATILYPGAFADVDIASTADRFYRFFVGAPLYREMATLFGPFAPLNASAVGNTEGGPSL